MIGQRFGKLVVEKQLNVDVLVVLETMWGTGRDVAPKVFAINPDNFSGRRLYKLLGDKKFLVTNACREQTTAASEHGTPDPTRLAYNLQIVTYRLLLVCGQVAWDTYKQCGYKPRCRVVKMKHPAARTWTNAEIERWREYLK